MIHITPHIIEQLGAKPIGNFPTEIMAQIVTDSRHHFFSSDTLFLGLKGPNFDGNNYLQDAATKGCKWFITEREDLVPEGCGALVVKDGLTALQLLAKVHRERFSIPVVAITGSNGKTIVKDWLFDLCTTTYRVHKSPKSYNSQVGVALSLLGIEEHHELAIIEAGISRSGEMQKLEQMIQPTHGIFTNLGVAHKEGFDSKEEKLNEKLKLFQKCGTVFIQDSKVFEQLRQEDFSKWKPTKTFSWIDLETDISTRNLATAATMAAHLGISESEVRKRSQNLPQLDMRLQLLKGNWDCNIINDGYSFDLLSLDAALRFQSKHGEDKKKTIVLTDYAEQVDAAEYRKVVELLHVYGIRRVIAIGTELEKHLQNFEHNAYKNVDDFLATPPTFEKESIVLKGARKNRLERLLPFLVQKSHRTFLEFNLTAMSHNIDFFRSRLKPETKLMAMVKAASYGGGTHEVANQLAYKNLDYLCVAYPDEASALREAGLAMPIMVLNSGVVHLDVFIKNELQPVVYSLAYLNELRTELRGRSLKIHLELDTGMNRLGMNHANFHEALKLIDHTDGLEAVSVFTHLATADEPSSADFAKKQIKIFEDWTQGTELIKHVCNTAGVLRFPEAHFDMVRLGIGMYGINPLEEPIPLENVLSLKTEISQIKEVDKGESVGYSRAFVAKEKTKIAVLPIGYADGMRRAWGNGRAKVYINGKPAKTVGNICMDMCMVNISNLNCKEGDEAVIFETEEQVKLLAKAMDSITYEVFTGISTRVNRVFVEE